ncbi:MAG: M1 family metallopeptidase [Deltaproteobacteria bacterium]|nr:M1 family metallopeptidase [Deltaproteobacteria bacterium]
MSDYRLPRHFLPAAYAIDLDASPKKSTFKGIVRISGALAGSKKSIELNARAITVKKAVLIAGRTTIVAKAKVNRARETIELAFKKALPEGHVVLEVHYAGKLDPAMHGLYLAKEGKERSLVSQCEATDARAIFPCMDEPEFKATLEWTVRTDKGLTVITNGVPRGPLKNEKGRAVHRFLATRPVSTYLAAVTIGAYEATKAEKVSGVPCRVLTAVGKKSQTGAAAEVTRFVLPWYERYFGQPYHYQKLDQVAVSGFDAGAMENIGAIFYRQSRLLMQPGQTSWGAEKSIAEVVAHEIAHQWFGNRVTMKWWDDLWLNEAFATWIAFKAIDEWKRDWRMWDDYQEDKEGALFADALVNTHPIYTPVKSPAEATELFDVITYSKGGAVLRMLESYLGADKFRAGIQRYMDAFKDRNASGADLWMKLEEASEEPVSALMQSWVGQSGFPLLSVETSQGEGRTTLHLKQRRFFLSSDEMNKEHKQTWEIPVIIRYGTPNGVREKRVLMKEHALSVTIDDSVTWAYCNADAVGFYRMHLDAPAIAQLRSAGLSVLSPAERLSLLEDQWALVRSGMIDISEFMDVLSAFEGESDYVVARALAARVDMLDQRLVADADRPAFQRLVARLFAAPYEKLGVEPKAKEKPETNVLRATIVGVLGEVAQLPAVLDAASAMAAKERKNAAAVEPNLAAVVVELAAQKGDSKLLDTYVATFKERQKKKTTPELQARYLSSLPAFRDAKLTARVLELCVDGTVPQESLRSVLVPMLSRRQTQLAAWAFLKKQWKHIGPRIGAMGISRLVEATGALPPELEKDVASFFKKNPVDEAARALKKALEAMALNRELKARESGRLSAWLRENVPAALRKAS